MTRLLFADEGPRTLQGWGHPLLLSNSVHIFFVLIADTHFLLDQHTAGPS